MNLRHILPISLATIALGFASVSCHSGAQKLGSEISGVWADTPEAFSDNAAVTAMVTDTYYFMPDTTGNARQPSGRFPFRVWSRSTPRLSARILRFRL